MGKGISIFGAGLSGLIAARMLHEHGPTVYERQDKLPNNHHAVLRFRSSIVGDVTNIPLRKVRVTKAVVGGSNPVYDMVGYSLKTTGVLHERSISSLEPVDRYVSPRDFIARLASTAKIQTGVDFIDWSHNLIKEHGPIISTIPMPVMMDIFKWTDRPEMNYRNGWNLTVTLHENLDCNINATLYNPDPYTPWYRATLMDEKIIFEGAGDPSDFDEEEIDEWLGNFCLTYGYVANHKIRSAKYQKISDLSRSDRLKADAFMVWLSKEKNIYSLGRFATWRPKLLLDDVVNDVRAIMNMAK